MSHATLASFKRLELSFKEGKLPVVTVPLEQHTDLRVPGAHLTMMNGKINVLRDNLLVMEVMGNLQIFCEQ